MEYSNLLSLIGVFFFGISGTMVAARARLDLFGVAFVACVGALGGGTLRDLLIGHYPLRWVDDYRYIAAVLAGVMTALVFRDKLMAVKKLIFAADTLGIGFFMVSGIRLCLESGLSSPIALVFGMLSVIVGGLLRDVLCNEVPIIRRKELVATASFAGGIVYLLLAWFQLPETLNTAGAVGFVALLRVLGWRYKWQLPTVNWH